MFQNIVSNIRSWANTHVWPFTTIANLNVKIASLNNEIVKVRKTLWNAHADLGLIMRYAAMNSISTTELASDGKDAPYMLYQRAQPKIKAELNIEPVTKLKFYDVQMIPLTSEPIYTRTAVDEHTLDMLSNEGKEDFKEHMANAISRQFADFMARNVTEKLSERLKIL